MPLTDEQKSAIAGLKDALKDVKDDADIEEASTELKAAVFPVWNHAHNTGHQKATGQESKATKALTKRAEQAETRVQELEQQLASGATPEVAKQLKDAQDEVRTLRQQLAEKDKEHAKIEEERVLSDWLRKFRRFLEDPEVGSIRPTWAKNIEADPDLRKRLRRMNGELVVMQAGKDVPIAAEDDTEDAQLRALALEQRRRLEREDPDAIRVGMDSGAGDIVHGDARPPRPRSADDNKNRLRRTGAY